MPWVDLFQHYGSIPGAVITARGSTSGNSYWEGSVTLNPEEAAFLQDWGSGMLVQMYWPASGVDGGVTVNNFGVYGPDSIQWNPARINSIYPYSDDGFLVSPGTRIRVRARFSGAVVEGADWGALGAGSAGFVFLDTSGGGIFLSRDFAEFSGSIVEGEWTLWSEHEVSEDDASPSNQHSEFQGIGHQTRTPDAASPPAQYMEVEWQVWVDDPDPPDPPEDCNYDCECEGGERNVRTLGELRATLFDRLGFSDPLAGPEQRTLSALRRDLAIRCGYASSANRLPPGVPELFDQLINEAQQKLWRRLELDSGDQPLPPRMVADDDVTVLDAPLVFALALGEAKAHLGKQDSKIYLDQAERMLADYMRRRPAGVRRIVTSILQEAQRFLFEKVASFRQSRFFRWPLEQGVRFYDFAGNDDLCGLRFVPELVEGVYVTDSDCPSERWRPLHAGIDPLLYNGGVRESWPQRYEFRQCIEIFPAPDERAGFLRVKGKFDIQRFEEDGDVSSIDADLILMHAIAVAKQQFGQQDYQTYQAMLQSRIGDIVAGSHHTRRYIPGDGPWLDATPPRPRDGFLPSE